MYNKSVSKIELVCKIASEMPVTPVVSYLLCDSWYICDKVIKSIITWVNTVPYTVIDRLCI